MTPPLVFFGFTALADPARHREYNAWHQLDHLPENLRLPGVVWGDRWVRSPDCRPSSDQGATQLAAPDYALMYWFAEPEETSVEAWRLLAGQSIQWGRRPELAWTHRMPVGFFRPVKGYASARVLVTADALPMRPHRGVHILLTRIEAPDSPQAVAAYAREDQETMPELVRRPGVAGGWIYSFAAAPAGFGAPAAADDPGPGQLRLRLLFLDGEIGGVNLQRPPLAPGEQLVFASTFRTITPWEWDWFEAGTSLS